MKFKLIPMICITARLSRRLLSANLYGTLALRQAVYRAVTATQTALDEEVKSGLFATWELAPHFVEMNRLWFVFKHPEWLSASDAEVDYELCLRKEHCSEEIVIEWKQ